MKKRIITLLALLISITFIPLAFSEVGKARILPAKVTIPCYKDLDKDGYCRAAPTRYFQNIESCKASGFIPRYECKGFELPFCDLNENLTPVKNKVCNAENVNKIGLPRDVCVVMEDKDNDGYPVIKKIYTPLINPDEHSIQIQGYRFEDRCKELGGKLVYVVNLRKILQDCNDLDPAVHPNAREICDGKDNDCDKKIDEGCPIDQTVKIIKLYPGRWQKIGYIPLEKAKELVENDLAKYVCYYVNGYVCVRKSITGEVYIAMIKRGNIERLPEFETESYMAAIVKPNQDFEWPLQEVDVIKIENPYKNGKFLTLASIPVDSIEKIKVECDKDSRAYLIDKIGGIWMAYNLVKGESYCYNFGWKPCEREFRITPYIGTYVYIKGNCTLYFNDFTDLPDFPIDLPE